MPRSRGGQYRLNVPRPDAGPPPVRITRERVDKRTGQVTLETEVLVSPLTLAMHRVSTGVGLSRTRHTRAPDGLVSAGAPALPVGSDETRPTAGTLSGS